MRRVEGDSDVATHDISIGNFGLSSTTEGERVWKSVPLGEFSVSDESS